MAGDEAPLAKPPWFARREIPVFMYRINRRPAQPPLFDGDGQLHESQPQPEPFINHLVECLLFGPVVTTTGRGSERHWQLGNRRIGPGDEPEYASGWIGYKAPDAQEQDSYDAASASWEINVVATERQATAPFVLMAGSRYLLVAKHPTFAPGTIPVIFETLLNQGEQERTNRIPSTLWAVEPLLDSPDFQRWLDNTAVLDRIGFRVRLPNPDASESFEQIARHMTARRASELKHGLTPRDPNQGLDKDFENEPISQGLLEMARRSFAQITAKGRSARGRLREYSQRQRVRKEHVQLEADPDAATQGLIERGLQVQQEDSA